MAYDSFGKPKILTDQNVAGTRKMSELLPFRFKGHYYDTESGLYYVGGNYYDPSTGRYINAGAALDLVSQCASVNGANLFAENPQRMGSFGGTHEFAMAMQTTDVTKERVEVPWYVHLAIGVGLIAVLGAGALIAKAAGALAAHCLLTTMFVDSLVMAATTACISALSVAMVGILGAQGIGDIMQSALEAASEGFMWGAVIGAITGAVNPRVCFAAGTLVSAAEGLKKIEDIEEGDLVWAYESINFEKWRRC